MSDYIRLTEAPMWCIQYPAGLTAAGRASKAAREAMGA